MVVLEELSSLTLCEEKLNPGYLNLKKGVTPNKPRMIWRCFSVF